MIATLAIAAACTATALLLLVVLIGPEDPDSR